VRERHVIAFLALLSSVVAPSIAGSEDASVTPREHRRPQNQTYLVFPEWCLVHSPNEFATFTADHPPSRYPFFDNLGQLWSSYGEVIEATERYEPNPGYHAMILVIATSTTAEYALRAGYESLIGRTVEVTQSGDTTAEERFGAQVAREYVDFINQRPWYEFDYPNALYRLWFETPLLGGDLVRKWERRYVLTTEYLFKAGYADLLRAGTRATYEVPLEHTAVVVEDLPEPLPDGVELEVIETLDDGAVVGLLPRYHAFGFQAESLALAGARFREVAGNRGPILLSALGPAGAAERSVEHRRFLVQPIATRPGEERVVLEVMVADLARAFLDLRGAGYELEHVYDY